MVILRQKEFISTGLKIATRAKIAGSNIRFLGGIGKKAVMRGVETAEHMAISPNLALNTVGKSVVKSNKETIELAKKTARDLGSREVSGKKKVGIVLNVATDFIPKAAFGKHLAQEAYETAGKSGKDVVKSLSHFATNPAASSGEVLSGFRQGGHGQKFIGGKWIGPGVNKWCIGIAPDSVLSGVGEFTSQALGEENLKREREAIQNSREARRFARSYDRTVGKVLNPIHTTIGRIGKKN